ncbi:MAG TPA: acyltransferase family protein [Paenirhodobacter sp.]
MAKGIGIILVVFGHAWRGIEAAGVLPSDEMFRIVDSAIYAFHMPLFFFLAGWFFPGTLKRFGQRELLSRIFWRLFYPMCLWTYIFIALKILAGTTPNDSVGFIDLLILPVPGQLHLWFLWAMILIQGTMVLLRPLALQGMAPFFAVALGVTVLLWISSLVPGSEWTSGAIRSAPFFCLGAMWHLLEREIPGSRKTAWLAVVALVIAEGVVLMQSEAGPALRLLIGVTAVMAVLIIIRACEARAGRLGRVLVLLGQYSMTIYLMHTIFSAAIRILLSKGLGIEAIIPTLILTVLGGIFVPLVVHLRPVPAMLTKMLGLPGANTLTLVETSRTPVRP